MAKKNYSLLENKIIDIFNHTSDFIFNGKNYKVLTVGKPRPLSGRAGGECKTDVYILGEAEKQKIELKISVKTLSSNEFQGNKLTAEQAELYFGENWSDIIMKASKPLQSQFLDCPLIDVSGHHPTKPNSIILDWKLEIASKSRNLSSLIPLSNDEIRNYVYRGTNQTDEKKNASINGVKIQDSGIADYILETELEDINTVEDILNKMVLISEMVIKPTYFIFTANNYRTDVRKADGPRSLAVYINWSCIDNKLTPKLVFDEPLMYTGQNDIKPILLSALKELGKNHPCEMDLENDIASLVKYRL